MSPTFETTFTALPDDIDELGHVNNAVWVRWMEKVATAHWYAAARPEDVERYYWVVVRHEIDYLRPAFEGETITARTRVDEAPKGARFGRFIEFVGPEGKTCVRAATQWAIIDRTAGRPVRVPAEVVAPFTGEG